MVNRVILVGNLGADPEVKTFEGGNKNATISLATSESYKNKAGEKVTDTEWHRVVFWGKLAEIVEKYLKKGAQVYVSGKNKTRTYEDKEGNTQYVREVIANEMQMLGSKSQNSEKSAEPEQKESLTPDPENSDLPF